MRSLHTRADPHRILDDPWGDRLVPDEIRTRIYQMSRGHDPSLPEVPDDATARAVVDTYLRTNVAYPNIVMRSRYAEDALLRAVARGVRQYVLIGAGFDSFALRLPAAAAGVTVVEIDHPATQSLKRACFAKAGVTVPASVHFVAADLSVQDLGSVLRAAPLRLGEPVFFSWLGVTMYLTRAANVATLRAIAATAAAGSELVFSYLDQAAFDLAKQVPSNAGYRLVQDVASVGEPFLSGFDPPALKNDLAQLGYTLLEDQSDVELLRTYDPQGRNGLTPGGRSRIAHARVAGN